MSSLDVDKLIENLGILNSTYLWAIEEGNKIIEQIEALDNYNGKDKYKKLEKLRDQFIELQNRHISDSRLYRKYIKESREYFKKKYNVDLLALLKDEDINLDL